MIKYCISENKYPDYLDCDLCQLGPLHCPFEDCSFRVGYYFDYDPEFKNAKKRSIILTCYE